MTDQQIEQCIINLHRFFEGWLSGVAEPGGDGLSLLEDALHPDFTMINPDGSTTDRPSVLSVITAARATVPGLVIEIANVRLVAADAGLVVASYEERQRWPGGANSRLSTATFLSPTAEGGQLRWLHVHETWLDTGRP